MACQSRHAFFIAQKQVLTAIERHRKEPMTDQSQQPDAPHEALFNETLVDLTSWLTRQRESLSKPGDPVTNMGRGLKHSIVPKKVAFYETILRLQHEGVHIQLGYRSAQHFATRNDISFYLGTPQLNSEPLTNKGDITFTSCTCGNVWSENLMHLPLDAFQALPGHQSFDRVLQPINEPKPQQEGTNNG